MIYYWKCNICKIDEIEYESLTDAQTKLEEHEKELHKKKFVGCFGINYIKNFYNRGGIDELV